MDVVVVVVVVVGAVAGAITLLSTYSIPSEFQCWPGVIFKCYDGIERVIATIQQ